MARVVQGSVTQTPAATFSDKWCGGELSTEQVPGDTPYPDMALVRWRIICIVRNMERFSEGLRSPLLFWECILVPAELINYKPNILLATTLHISLASCYIHPCYNWLWCEIFVWDKWTWRNCSRACIESEDSYYRLLPCHSLLKLSWYIILKYFRVYFHSLLIALICITIYLRITWI